MEGAPKVFDPETVAFLESGCALIVGLVGGEGAPHATRGWGLTVLDRHDGRVRLLVDAADARARACIADTGAVAITAAHVPTLRSLQLKGRSAAVEPATGADRARARAYCDAFFTDIEGTDGTPRSLPERLVPRDFVAVAVAVAECFDQTPGPGAGARVGAPA